MKNEVVSSGGKNQYIESKKRFRDVGWILPISSSPNGKRASDSTVAESVSVNACLSPGDSFAPLGYRHGGALSLTTLN